VIVRIGINVSRLSGQRLGVGRYLEYLLKHWSQMLAPEEEVHAYLREAVSAESIMHLNLSSSIKLQQVGPKLPGLLWENLSLPRRARHMDVLFGPSYSLPLLARVPRKRVVATHSVNQTQAGAHQSWYNLTYGKWHQLSALSADAVIVPCNSTADLVNSQYGVPLEKIVVIPQGADTSFRPLNDVELARRTRTEFLNENVPYVLFVGKLSMRRNIPNLIAAFAKVKKTNQLPHKLLLVGPNHQNLPLAQISAEHGVSEAVVQSDGNFTDHEELVRIYNGADVFVHPSWFEGWSMTTIEALACGTATIAADRGGLGDVARGYAYMVEEPTVEALKSALEKVLLDESLREELKKLARQRGSAITWEDTTRQTLDVIRNVAKN
jgi:glycosyltransferase involved in cell wall biosynthesis